MCAADGGEKIQSTTVGGWFDRSIISPNNIPDTSVDPDRITAVIRTVSATSALSPKAVERQ